MTFQPIPVQRFLVPDQNPVAPEGFVEVSEAILGGLPHIIQLDQEVKLVLFVATGLAATWRDVDPTTVVSQSDGELAPAAAGGDFPIADVRRAAAHVAVKVGSAIVASVPLAAGLRRVLPDAGDSDGGSRIELLVLSWDIRAGSLRGPGDFGSRVRLAWRRADKAVEKFSTSSVSSQIVARLEPEFRMESELGSIEAARLARFKNKKVVRQ